MTIRRSEASLNLSGMASPPPIRRETAWAKKLYAHLTKIAQQYLSTLIPACVALADKVLSRISSVMQLWIQPTLDTSLPQLTRQFIKMLGHRGDAQLATFRAAPEEGFVPKGIDPNDWILTCDPQKTIELRRLIIRALSPLRLQGCLETAPHAQCSDNELRMAIANFFGHNILGISSTLDCHAHFNHLRQLMQRQISFDSPEIAKWIEQVEQHLTDDQNALLPAMKASGHQQQQLCAMLAAWVSFSHTFESGCIAIRKRLRSSPEIFESIHQRVLSGEPVTKVLQDDQNLQRHLVEALRLDASQGLIRQNDATIAAFINDLHIGPSQNYADKIELNFSRAETFVGRNPNRYDPDRACLQTLPSSWRMLPWVPFGWGTHACPAAGFVQRFLSVWIGTLCYLESHPTK